MIRTNATHRTGRGEKRRPPTFELVAHILAESLSDDVRRQTADGGTIPTVTLLTSYFKIAMTDVIFRYEHLYGYIPSYHDGQDDQARRQLIMEENKTVIQLRIAGGSATVWPLVEPNPATAEEGLIWIKGVGSFDAGDSNIRDLGYGEEELILPLSHEHSGSAEYLLGAAFSGERLEVVQMPTDRESDDARRLSVALFDARSDERGTRGRVIFGSLNYGSVVSPGTRHLCFTGEERFDESPWLYDWLTELLGRIRSPHLGSAAALKVNVGSPALKSHIEYAQAALGVVFPLSLRASINSTTV